MAKWRRNKRSKNIRREDASSTHRKKMIQNAADIAISSRDYPGGAVSTTDVQRVALEQFGLTVSDIDASFMLLERLRFRGWNSDGTGFIGEE